MECREGCGACCIAPSISTFIPNMAKGKVSGQVCLQLTENYQCKLFGKPERPQVCLEFLPTQDVCGESRVEAMENLTQLEQQTKP